MQDGGFDVVETGEPIDELPAPQALGSRLDYLGGSRGLDRAGERCQNVPGVHDTSTIREVGVLHAETTKSRDLDSRVGWFYWFAVNAVGAAGASSKSFIPLCQGRLRNNARFREREAWFDRLTMTSS